MQGLVVVPGVRVSTAELEAPEYSRLHFSCKFLTAATSWDRRCTRREQITSPLTRRCSRMDKVRSPVLIRVKACADHIGHRDEHFHLGHRAHHYDVPALPFWACLRLEGVCRLLFYPLRGKVLTFLIEVQVHSHGPSTVVQPLVWFRWLVVSGILS